MADEGPARVVRAATSPVRRFFDFTSLNVSLNALPSAAPCPPLETPLPPPFIEPRSPAVTFPVELTQHGPYAHPLGLPDDAQNDEEKPTDRAMLLAHADRLVDHVSLEGESETRRKIMSNDPLMLAKIVSMTKSENVNFVDIENVVELRSTSDRERTCGLIDALDEKGIGDELLVPNEFICPLSLRAMRDPVAAADHLIYESAYAERHLFLQGCTSPTTREPMTSGNLYEVRPLRNLMSTWAEKAASMILCGPHIDMPPAERVDVATQLVNSGKVK